MGTAAGTICEEKNGEMGVYLHFLNGWSVAFIDFD
jgi:hypothetical protein